MHRRAVLCMIMLCHAMCSADIARCGAVRYSNLPCPALPCCVSGDDVDKKKPDPKIYNVAAQKLGLDPSECLVVEDSTIGLQAATGAGMRCIITYTPSTKQQVGHKGWEGSTAVDAFG